MNIREEIIESINTLPESELPAVKEFITSRPRAKKSGLLRRLSEIKIDGPADFSRNIDLYLSGEKKIEENIS